MKEKIEQISKEIMELKPKSKIDFNKYFIKYGILEEKDKFECYETIIKNLKNEISLGKEFKNAFVGLPFNIPHIKN